MKRKEAEKLSQELKAVVDSWLTKHPEISYDKHSVVFGDFLKVSFTFNEGTKEEAEKKLFDLYCSQFDCKPEHYRKSFLFQDKKYLLVGFALNSPKYCIIGQSSSGKSYKFTESVLSQIRTPEFKMPNKVTMVHASDLAPTGTPFEVALKEQPAKLKNDWCTCGNPSDLHSYFGDGVCSCGCHKHHYHCSNCGKITQVG